MFSRAGLAALCVALAPASAAGELPAARVIAPSGPAGEQVGFWSERVLAVALEVDAASARVMGATVKERPYTRRLVLDPPQAAVEGAGTVQIEVVLLGPAGQRFTERLELAGLCLAHDAAQPPHITGDRIRLHREAFVVNLPKLAGFDRLEIAYYTTDARRPVAVLTLDEPAAPQAATVLWPESFGDDDLYLVLGDESEGAERINVVVVPDGYRYADKAVMEQHFTDLVAYFRATRPFTEHDPFMNYILVYAYAVEAGTDQCDCGIVLDTPMGTGFPDAVPVCGASDNRCLYYGSPCDTSGTGNIVAAELRAPFQDETIVMVNTERYGGCGGQRAVYSAANSAATDIAVHELGHSLAILADEYDGNPGCGGFAGEINTSEDGVDGAWPEWVAELGAPRQGAEYFNQCIYRPLPTCEMRSLFQPFCPVCNQRWSLKTFGHPNVSPTAPVAGFAPASPLAVEPWEPQLFALDTRLSVGPNVTNAITWKLTVPPGTTTTVASGTTSHTQTFSVEGLHALEATVIADTNFVKPQKYGANRDVVTWNVLVVAQTPPTEVSPPGSGAPLVFTTKKRLMWQQPSASGSVTFNVYSGLLTALPGGSYGTCLQSNVPQNWLDTLGQPAPGTGRFYLVTGRNSAGEGPMGSDSAGQPRTPAVACP